MKTISLLFMMLCSVLSFAQSEDTLIQSKQEDDTYLAGETIKVDAVINGDLFAAGRQLVTTDSIYGDLVAAGARLSIENYIADDVRIAAATIIVDSEIGDDLVVFGGDVRITENAVIRGNVIGFARDIEIEGTIDGKLDIEASKITINGEINDTSRIVSEDIVIGSNAKFYKDVEYWSSDDQLDFKESLINSEAQFNEALEEEKSAVSLLTFGMTSFTAWIFYIVSVLLVILVFNGLFRNAFSNAVEGLEGNYLKSFGYGLIYLIGVPLAIAIAFLIGIGLPLGLLMTGVFIFSILVGHFISALVIAYYIKHKKEMSWNFWGITLLALLLTVVLRLLTNIPYVGILLAVVILATTYGALTLEVIHSKKQLAKN
jgi:cytoskeletal protein CcmA (bactofilin family)